MKLETDFDDALMNKYSRRGAEPIFGIYWTHNGVSYPEKGWIDFGSIVLDWWLIAATALLNSSREEDFVFMDGPYRLSVRSVGDLFHVSMSDTPDPWKVSQELLVGELLSGAKRVRAKLAELQIPDNTGLEIGIKELSMAVSEHQGQGRTRQVAKQYIHH